MFFYVSGTLCANLSCTLIVSQMSNTRCELINILLVPLALAVALCLFIPGLLSTSELTILYMLSLVFTSFHIHYGICVVSEMSTHLNIEPLRIKNSYDKVRLISSKKAKTDAQRFQIPKNPPKIFYEKICEIDWSHNMHTTIWQVLNEYVAHAITGNGNDANLLKLAWKNLWKHIKSTSFWAGNFWHLEPLCDKKWQWWLQWQQWTRCSRR